MFKAPFSFNGRIRRLEFGLTYIFYFIFMVITGSLLDIYEVLDSIILILYLIFFWVLIAQGAKRCHDLNNSGFFQLIPFYFFIQLFQEGDPEENKFGLNPKSQEYLNSERPKTTFKLQKISKQSLLEIIVISLISAILLSINNILFMGNETYIIISYFLLPIPSFLAFLFLSYSKKRPEINKAYRITQQLYFSAIYYIIIRSYTVHAREANFNVYEILNELVAIGILMAITFISVGLFHVFSAPKITHD